MYPPSSGRDEDEQEYHETDEEEEYDDEDDEYDENEEVDDEDDEYDENEEVDDEDENDVEHQPDHMAPYPGIPKAWIVFQGIFYGILVGAVLAGMLAILQVNPFSDAQRIGSRNSTTFLVLFLDNWKLCAAAVFLGVVVLNAVESLLQWNYDTTRRATRAMIRTIRRQGGNQDRRRREPVPEKSAQKIVEPLMHELNLQIEDEEERP